NYQIVAKSRLPILNYTGNRFDRRSLEHELAAAEWIVDALFGTGVSGPVRPPFDEIIGAINASARRVFAIDIPSGLDCDTGRPLGPTIRANHTATLVATKKGFVEPAAAEWVGKIHVVGIGIPRILLSSSSS